MPAITRLGDTNTGHDACPPTALVSASSNVYINGKGCGRMGDSYAPHGCVVHPTHTAHIVAGSGTVSVNGIAVARIGDAVDCGGSVAIGSGNVFAGG